MTNIEFHIAVDQELQKVGSYQYDSFLPEELDHWLNKGVDAFVSLNMSKVQDKPGQTFESNQEGLDSLRNLIVETDISFTDIPEENQANFTLPEDYRHYLSMRCGANYCDKPIKNPVRLMSNDDFYYSFSNPYLKPKPYSPILRIGVGAKGTLYYADSVEPTKLTLIYIKEPSLIDGANNPNVEYTDIPSPAHEAIVGITVRRITQSMLPLDYNSKIQENMLNKDV